MQDCARILQESCMQDLHAMCPFSCTILAQSCTYLARNGARFCKSCCKNNYLHFLNIFCKILQELVQDCARKGTYCVQVLILQVRFCWEGSIFSKNAPALLLSGFHLRGGGGRRGSFPPKQLNFPPKLTQLPPQDIANNYNYEVYPPFTVALQPHDP